MISLLIRLCGVRKMTYPPGNQPPAQKAGQQTHVSGSIMELEYKPPEAEQEQKPKKKKGGLKIFIFFAVLVILIIIVMSVLVLYLIWPREQVLELEEIAITNYKDAQDRRHWHVTGNVKNIGSEPLEISKIEISISGKVVVDDFRTTLDYICTSHEVTSRAKTKLETEETVGFRITEALLEESTQTTRPQLIIKLYYDGDEMDSAVEDVGGQW
jgi:hypothetical protein